MHPVMLLPDHADTSELRQALWRHRIGHRITDEADGQLLWIADPRQLGELKALLERWQRGEPLVLQQAAQRPRTMTHSLASLKQVPVTALMIVISLVIFALIGVFGDQLIVTLTIVPIGISGGELVFGNLTQTLTSGQVWRLLSPAFLHFGWMHLIFNLMWVWYFGRQVEALQGSRIMLLLLIVAGIGANVAQYATGTVLFGGMSGVVYALLAHVWLMSRRVPQSGFFVPQMLVVFMLGWMVFTMTDMAGSVGFGNVANEAHLGGLLVGLVTGWYYSSRRLKNR
ncbi:rhomboid family intramembrane serine protease [Halomonas sp. FeN2]|uniref:Rhomboid family intramembrane serine protease n=1 Tax=Vreelandella neptunia TaxID=115551 RepID=A0ABZ0YHA0_9GAMM|nr:MULTISPECIES: rhomboid family intramembrane serine protease [Halomonadaceae]TDV94529.1 GlpG protein [Halomonas alkaliantarctica]MBF59975.1 rhomboid family intramembrane serine protease [Halomonas sp.]MDN3560151.1 rhomboid family intramembrane serine protease [Halomonas neptunia]MEA2119899.1 rhomboid family intramembrane serine protease [Halovibrio sp. HP20-59]UBR50439.1 rhomboid family intramembrane serine protease [Halomonas sp. FeN2]|tara:strand:+ start:1809 stop:2660 length:852 start_codon:yes stop_codon:yes gene_type:complete